MSAPTRTREPLVEILVVDERTVGMIVRAIAPTPEWRRAARMYADLTAYGNTPSEDLEPAALAPVLAKLLEAVTTHVAFGGRAQLGQLHRLGCPQVLLKVLERQVQKVAARRAATEAGAPGEPAVTAPAAG